MTDTTYRALNKPADGDSNWGASLRENADDIDSALAGEVDQAVTGASPIAITAANAANARVNLTGSLTADKTVELPSSIKGFWVVDNQITYSGDYDLTFSVNGGSGFTVPRGKTVLTYSDGSTVENLGELQGALSTLSKSSGDDPYTVQTSDMGKLIQADDLELDLPSAATVGIGCSFQVANTGTSTVILDPSGVETINTWSIFPLGPGDTVELTCDGSNWIAKGAEPYCCYNVRSDGTAQNNVTGDATYYTVQFETELVDSDSSYNTGTGKVTVKVPGLYQVTAFAIVDSGIGATGRTVQGIITCSNRNYYCVWGATTNTSRQAFPSSAIVDCDAGDEIYFRIYGNGEGADNWDVDATAQRCWMSIARVGGL